MGTNDQGLGTYTIDGRTVDSKVPPEEWVAKNDIVIRDGPFGKVRWLDSKYDSPVATQKWLLPTSNIKASVVAAQLAKQDADQSLIDRVRSEARPSNVDTVDTDPDATALSNKLKIEGTQAGMTEEQVAEQEAEQSSTSSTTDTDGGGSDAGTGGAAPTGPDVEGVPVVLVVLALALVAWRYA